METNNQFLVPFPSCYVTIYHNIAHGPLGLQPPSEREMRLRLRASVVSSTRYFCTDFERSAVNVARDDLVYHCAVIISQYEDA